MSARPRRKGIWELQVKLITYNLTSWRNVFVILDDIVVILNFIMKLIQIFFLFFMKMFCVGVKEDSWPAKALPLGGSKSEVKIV